MKKIEVFGTGCKKCVTTENMIKDKASKMNVEIDLCHIYDPVEIVSRGIVTTPAVMVNGKLVHKGGLPSDIEIAGWISA